MQYQVTITRNIIQVIGYIWLPRTMAAMAAMEYTLSDSDLKRYGIDRKKPTRDQIERWIRTNTGDFSYIKDWYADIGQNKILDWKDPESEFIFNDCMFPLDDNGDMDIVN